ncbi:MAG: glycosyltransferase family 2 protein [Agriterribacter sp.]
MNNRSIDIVVPTYRLDEKVLLDIIHLPRPQQFEINIYIVSDNPAVIVPESLKALHDQGKIHLLVNEKNLGAPATRNVGIRAGSAAWILFLDDDIYPENNLLTVYGEAIEKHGVALGFAGITRFPAPFNIVTKALQIHGAVASFTEPLHKPSVIWSPTANVMLNRAKMDQTLFDGSLINAEDIDFLTRNSLLYNQRYISLPEAVVHHPWWNNGKVQTKRMISYGAGASQVAVKEPIKNYTYIDFTNTCETLLLLLLLLPFAVVAGHVYMATALLLIIPVAEFITNWIRGIINGKTYSLAIAFHLFWIKNCYEFGALKETLKSGRLKAFARRIEMGFNKPHPSPFRLNRWKIIKLTIISTLSLLVLLGRT